MLAVFRVSSKDQIDTYEPYEANIGIPNQTASLINSKKLKVEEERYER